MVTALLFLASAYATEPEVWISKQHPGLRVELNEKQKAVSVRLSEKIYQRPSLVLLTLQGANGQEIPIELQALDPKTSPLHYRGKLAGSESLAGFELQIGTQAGKPQVFRSRDLLRVPRSR